MHNLYPTLAFCGACGASLESNATTDKPLQARCAGCGAVTHVGSQGKGPALLVLTSVFAEHRLLLLKRGIPPYRGCWAPPGGYVDPGESLERAAVREIEEEVGIMIDPDRLLPHGIVSLPEMNQVYVIFLAVLDQIILPQPRLPEALAAGWFSEAEYSLADVWPPAADLDMRRIFESVRIGRLDFYQRSDASMRIVTGNAQLVYLWRR